MYKKSIALDMDCVLNDLLYKWIGAYNKDYNDTLRVIDIDRWDITQFVKPECGEHIYDYLIQEGFFYSQSPQKYSKAVVTKLCEKYDVYVVTAAHPKIVEEKYTWLKEHFPSIKEDNIVICKAKHIIGTDFLIDDCPDNIIDFKQRAVIYDAPYNRYLGSAGLAPRVRNWIDIEVMFGV